MLQDLRTAISFLTVFPAGYPADAPPGRAFAYFPLVGATLGAILAITALLPIATLLAAVLVLAAWVLLTGGLHLDGFADACDGLFASVPVARRLEIMKDPQAGSWAVVGLVLLMLGKWAALTELLPTPLWLVLPPVAGRWTLSAQAYFFAYARQDGLGGYFRRGLGRVQVATASVTAFGLLWGLGGLGVALLLSACAAAVAFGVGRWAARRLGGGLTGDVYGASCELTELACLVALTAIQ